MATFKVVVRKKRADGFYSVYIRVVHHSRMVHHGVIGAVMVSIILYLYKLDKKICTEKHNQIRFLRFVTMPGFLILNHIFFLLQCKFLAKIIGHTINLCNFRLWKHSGNRLNLIIQHYKFNTFIAMFLIITEIYLLLFRTHVNLNRSPNFMASCCEIVAQLANGMVHFFRILRYAR